MVKRSYFNSLRGEITNRALFIGILPVLLVGGLAYFGLSKLVNDAEDGINKSRAVLLDQVVGANLSATAAEVTEQLDTFLIERISDAITWISAPNVINAAREAARLHRDRGLPAMRTEQIEELFSNRKSLELFKQTDDYLIRQIDNSSHFAEVFMTDEYGYNVAMTNPTSDFVQSDEDWWIAAMDEGISVGQVEYDASAGIWSVDISVRIDDDTSGKRLGVMKAVLGVSLIQQIADNRAAQADGGSVTIANGDGLLLAETATGHAINRIMNPDTNLASLDQPSITKALSAVSAGYDIGPDTVTGFSRSAGEEVYGSIVQGFSGFNWLAIVSEPTETALSSIRDLETVQSELAGSRKTILIFSVIALIFVSLIALILARVLSNRIIGPLYQLQDAAERVAKGDTSRTISIQSNNEIEDLAKIFERMRNSVALLMNRYRKMQVNRKPSQPTREK